jgi:aminopeptidase N
VIEEVWNNRSTEMAGMLAAGLYPSLLVEQETVDRTEEFLASTTLPHGLHRVIAEALDGVQRALRCQACDATRDNSRG